MGTWRGVWAWGSLVWMALCALARAEAPARPALSWVRGPGAHSCVGAVELGRAIETHLDREILVAAPRAEIWVEGYASGDADGFHVMLRLHDAQGTPLGTRALATRNADCRSLDPLLAFVIALMLDPDAPLLPPELPEGLGASTHAMLEELFGGEPSVPDLSLAKPAPGPTAPVAAVPASRPAEASAATAPQPRLRPLLWAGAGLALLLGGLPAPAPGFEAGLGVLTRSDVRVDAAASLSLPVASDIAPSREFSRVMGSLRGCSPALRPLDWLEIRGCGGAAAGALRSRTDLATGTLQPTRFYAELMLGPEFGVPLGRSWSLRLDTRLLVPLVRDSFVLPLPGADLEVFRVGPVAGSLALGLFVGWP